MVHVENDDRHTVIHAEAESRGVHDLEAAGESLRERDMSKAFGGGVFDGVRVVDAIDFGGFEDDVGTDFVGAEGSGGIGRKERVAGAGDKDNDTTVFQVARGAAEDEGFGDIVHFDGTLDASGDTDIFEGAHESHAIDDGSEHSHVIGGGAVHAPVAGGETTPDVATAHDDGEFDPHGVDFFDFRSHGRNDLRGDAFRFSRSPESFAADFQNDTLVSRLIGGCLRWCRHGTSI